ncbi:MAG: dihydroorotate dehydrogenase-like protein [Planctomycetaceae bacterium]|nr:dihydroorotate dehydrogenase-like protein [Planctomycetaceae bacterium]
MSHSLDLSTRWLGLDLPNPILASACPHTADLDHLKRLADAGVAAAVMPSLFEEQIEFEEWQFGGLMDYGADSFAEAGNYFPELADYNSGPDRYLETIEEARQTVDIPIVGSLNGVTRGGWTRFARQIESAGASALELNMYYLPTDPEVTSQQLEETYLELVHEVKSNISIQLGVKIGPFFSSLPNFAARLFEAGADGLILFNRFLQPDLKNDLTEIDAQLSLSDPREIRLPLRWIAILYGRVSGQLAATSGISSGEDVMKMLLAGADVAMVTSILLKKGPGYVTEMLTQMSRWMGEHGYQSVSQLKGSMSHKNCPNPGALERSNYMKALTSFQSPDLI